MYKSLLCQAVMAALEGPFFAPKFRPDAEAEQC